MGLGFVALGLGFEALALGFETFGLGFETASGVSRIYVYLRAYGSGASRMYAFFAFKVHVDVATLQQFVHFL